MSKKDDYVALLALLAGKKVRDDVFSDGLGHLKELLLPLEKREQWSKENLAYYTYVEKIYKRMDPEALASLRASMLSSFYTSDDVCKSIVNNINVKNASEGERIQVLEPSAGSGNFLEAIYNKYPKASVTALEKDKIASILLNHKGRNYRNFESKNLAFEDLPISKKYDLVISNVPFGRIRVYDELFLKGDDIQKKSLEAIHSYFFVKGLDVVSNGGVLAFITSAGFSDSLSNDKYRQRLIEQGNLLYFCRLPMETFNHADVSSDLIIIQKNENKQRKDITGVEKMFAKGFDSQVKNQKFRYNDLLSQHPQLFIGKPRVETNSFGNISIRARGVKKDDIGYALYQKMKETISLEKVYTGTSAPSIVKIDSPKESIQQKKSFVVEQLTLFDFDSQPKTPIVSASSSNDKKSNVIENSISDSLLEVRYSALDDKYKLLFDEPSKIYGVGNLMVFSAGKEVKGDTLSFKGNTVCKIETIEKVDVEVDGEESKKYQVTVSPVSKKYQAQSRNLQTIIELRDRYMNLFNNERSTEYPSNQLEQDRKELLTTYNSFVTSSGLPLHGRLNKDLINLDIDSHRILTLEIWDEQKKKYKPSDVLFKRAYDPVKEYQINNLNDGIIKSLNKFNKLDIDWIAEKLEIDKDALIEQGLREERFFYDYDVKDKSLKISLKDEFLSGKVSEKIAYFNDIKGKKIEDVPDFLKKNLLKQIDMLSEVLPNFVTFEMMDLKLGERWIPVDVFEKHASEYLDVEARVVYNNQLDTFSVDNLNTYKEADHFVCQGKSIVEKNVSMLDMYSSAMVNSVPKYTYYNGKDTLPDTAAIESHQRKITEIQENFKEWVGENTEVKTFLENKYNEMFNSTVEKKFDGSHLEVEGLKNVNLYDHQKDAIWKLLQKDGGLLNHNVGYGKTLTMICAAIKMKSLGIASKPCILAMKANVTDIIEEFRKFFPHAKLAYPDKKEFAVSERKQFFQKIMNNDWDCVILTHEQFLKIPQSLEIEYGILEEYAKEARNNLDVYESELTSKSKDKSLVRLRKSLEKELENKETKLKETLYRIDKDRNVADFGRMGIDHLFVDESHIYKNLEFTTKMDVVGIGNPKGSDRALNMLTAVRTLQDMKGGDRGVTFSSGTPISNSLVELYLLFQYLAPSELKRKNLNSLDSWASVFANKKTDFELVVGEEAKKVSRLSQFVKIPELMKLYNGMSSIANENNCPKMALDNIPKAVYNNVLVEPTPAQVNLVKQVVDFTQSGGDSAVGHNPPMRGEKSRNAYMLVGANYARQLSIEPRLIDHSARAGDSNKIIKMCENVASVYKETEAVRGAQIIFCDTGTPKSNKNDYSTYNTIRKKLIEDHGIPIEEIQFIHDHDINKEKKSLFFQSINEGKVRVVLGSTQKLGTGVNVQKRLAAVHHLDLPYKSTDMIQRNGRAIRKGNLLDLVKIFTYAVNKSIDSYLMFILKTKNDFIEQIQSGSITDRRIDENTVIQGKSIKMKYTDFLALLTDNNLIMKRAKIEEEIKNKERRLFDYQTIVRKSVSKSTRLKSNIDYLGYQLDIHRIDKKEFMKDFYQMDKKEKVHSFQNPVVITYGNKKTPISNSTDLGKQLLLVEKDILDKNNDRGSVAEWGNFHLFPKIKTYPSNEGTIKKAVHYHVQNVMNNSSVNHEYGRKALPKSDPQKAGEYIVNALKNMDHEIDILMGQKKSQENDLGRLDSGSYEKDIASLKTEVKTLKKASAKINLEIEKLDEKEEKKEEKTSRGVSM